MSGMLECKEVGKQYDEFCMKDVSFRIRRGYVTGLIGINGAGKTTLLRILSGHMENYEGNVYVDEMDIRENLYYAKKKITLISEEIQFFMNKSALENGQMLGELFDDWSLEKYYGWLDRLEIPKGQPLYQFSKGMYMKFQVGFALAHGTEFLVMDEPTAGFDPVFRRDFIGILQEIRENNIGILLSTHIMSDIDCIADYILVLNDGVLTCNDTKENLEDEGRSILGENQKYSIADLLKRAGRRRP